MKTASIFDEIKNNPNYSLGKSIDWYKKRIKELAVKANDPRLLRDKDRVRRSVQPGFLYLFAYDAKHKDTLPYWDKFPLTFVFDFTPNGFIGINFHYLPYSARFALFDRMILGAMKADDFKYDDKMKLKLNWSILKNAARYPQVKPAIKQYLMPNVQSNFIKIPISDWKTALLLPVDNFVGASRTKVWADSKELMRK